MKIKPFASVTAWARDFWQLALATNQLGYDPVYLLARAALVR